MVDVPGRRHNKIPSVEILLVEDDRIMRRFISRSLSMKGHEVQAVESAEKALELLETRQFPMLFVDIGLPGMNGLDFIRKIRQRETEPPMYILVGTGQTGEKHLNEILDAGADDYLAKPFESDVLDTRLLIAANNVAVLKERSRLRRELIHLADHDPLTGLLNRRQLEPRLQSAINSREPVVFLQLDLDHFKQINDVYGHHAGDQHLRRIARLLREMLPESAHVMRLGGDEFVALIEGISVREAFEQAEAIIAQICGIHIGGSGGSLRTGASIGITDVRRSSSPEGLMKEADQACYRAKSLGKSCAQVYVPFDADSIFRESERDSFLDVHEDRF